MESTVDPITIQGFHPHDPCVLALEGIASAGARAAVADRAQYTVGTSSMTDFLEAPARRLSAGPLWRTRLLLEEAGATSPPRRTPACRPLRESGMQAAGDWLCGEAGASGDSDLGRPVEARICPRILFDEREGRAGFCRGEARGIAASPGRRDGSVAGPGWRFGSTRSRRVIYGAPIVAARRRGRKCGQWWARR
jgi:hypothetical protein